MMQNYICWDPSGVHQVINPFAEHISDSLFRAVHVDWDLQVAGPIGKSFQEIGDSAFTEMTPADFLKDFMSPERPHALAAILGETGSGKSHLVHWMRLHLPETKDRMVLVVRKSGTSLRAIVREIIGKLPEDQQQSFLDIFNAAGDGSMGREGRQHELLNHLAQAIREESLEQVTDETEEALLSTLPDLIQDPYMRKEHFLREGGVVGEIVDHIFAESNAKDRPDQRRLFSEEDLALGGMDFVNATKLARDAIQIINIDPVENTAIAIDIINRCLDAAVARTLSFSGDRIEELMSRLRMHLKEEGRELVLLVEEFARLQGIDRALLQAITSQGGDKQCRMRTAIAVTTGFFASVAETAYMRTTHIVDMTRSAGRAEGQKVTHSSLAQFSARYLNAARLGREAIENWYENAGPEDQAPSKCTQCPHMTDCHKAFGEVDGYGIYPFTEKALWIGASRLDKSMPDSLNPRVLQNNLFVEVLDTFASSISSGEFPSIKMLEKFGGVEKLSLTSENSLRGRDARHADRWIALLELYDGTGNIANLPSPINEAFSIPEIPDANAPIPAQHEEPTPNPGSTKKASDEDPNDLKIESWIRGGSLDQTIASRLREILFPAILETIDWDYLGLAKATFAGATGRPFQRNSISFVRQSTKASAHLQVKLEISADAKTGQALQGLLKASRKKFRWDFEGGDGDLLAFLDCLEEWSADVVSQLRKLTEVKEDWADVEAALQLLAVGAALGGRIRPDANLGDVINGMFQNWPDEPAATATEMRRLYAKLQSQRDNLVGTARAQISSMKGGQAGSMLDPRRIVRSVRAFRSGKWQMCLQPLEEDKGAIAKLYAEVSSILRDAANDEQTIRKDWLLEMEEAFGNELAKAEIISCLSSALEAAFDGGVSSSGHANALNEALEDFKAVQFDDSIQAARKVSKSENALEILPDFGRGRSNAVAAGTELKAAAEKFLDAVEQNLQTYGSEQGSTASDLEANIEKMREGLVMIVSDLQALSEQAEAEDVA